MNHGFFGRTLCLTNRHDITGPDAIGIDSGSGKRYCRACMREKKRARREADKLRQKLCRGCKIKLPIGRAWAFCTTKCEHNYRSRNAQQEDLEDARKTITLMDLYSELERAATSWERAEIRAKIAAVK